MEFTNIILVDSSTNIDNLKNSLSKEKNRLIITFDYTSHKKLENEKIIHKISDDYVSDQNYKDIQKYVYKFSYWYLNDNFSKLLTYDGINLAKLFLDELINFFVRFLKKFKEIETIYNLYPQKKFVANGELDDIINFFTTNVNSNPSIKKNSLEFTHDLIKVSLKIASFKKDIFIKKTSYLKIKNLVDIFAKIISNSKTNNNNKKILFSEFNTEKFSDLFIESKNHNTEIYFLGRRRPPFWNFSTLKTMLRSKCRIITDGDFEQKTISKNINSTLDQVKSQFEKLWKYDTLLNEYFLFEDYKIFKLIKPTLNELLDKKLSKTLYEIELANQTFQKFNFDYSVIINESGFSEQIISSLSKKYQIPCIHMQEGFHWDSIGAKENLSSQGVFLEDAEKLAVWGEIDKKLAIEIGKISPEKIHVIGAPRYDQLFRTDNSNEDYILLASSADPQPEEIEGLRIPKIEKYLNDIIKISKIISKLNENLVIKLHPSPTQLTNIAEIISTIDPKISVSSYGEISSLLPSAKLLISVGISSAMIEAMILKKPVLFIPGIDYNWGQPSIIPNNGCLISNMSEFENNLKNIIYVTNNNNYESSQNYLKKLISYQGNASPQFYKFLKNHF